MNQKKEFEIIQHTNMNYLEIFLTEIKTRRPHGHEDLEIGILLEGSITLYVEHETYELQEGSIYIINRHQLHSFLGNGNRNLILAFQIHTEFYRKLNYELAFLRFDNNVFHSGHLHKLLYDKLIACASCYFGETRYHELKCASILLDILYDVLNNSPYTIAMEKEYTVTQSNSNRINRITEYILEHYKERIRLEDIAALEGISPYHASHFITRMLGISFQEYLNNIRFEHALQLVNRSSLNILDICLETGFSNSRYLNQMFQKNLGCGVKEYMKMKDKPKYKMKNLPVDDTEIRYSFEQSAFLFQKRVKEL